MMTQKYWMIACVLLFFLVSCKGKENGKTLEDKLAKKWQLSRVLENDNETAQKPDSLDVLFLTNKDGKNSFAFKNSTESVDKKGLWAAENNNLYLVNVLEDTTIIVDSSVYSAHENSSELTLYNQGNLIAQLKNDKFDGIHITETFSIVELSENKLVLKEGIKSYVFEYHTAIPTLSFSFVSILRGLLGMILLVFIAYLFSNNRKAISWRVVITGLSMQIVLAIGVLKVPFIQHIFEGISSFFIVVLDFTREGSVFLLGDLLNINSYGFIFAFQVLPTIIFFSALTSVLFYLGIIQKVVYGLAWVMTKAMKLSGAESLSVAGNIFLGQTEAPLMIKAYLPKMNRSEILLVMIGGMATIAGGVLAAYVSFLGGDDPVMRLYFAKHLLTASVMAAPGAVVASKLLMPQTEDINKNIEITQDKIGSNILDAIANGTSEGLKLAVNVAAMLLVFIAFIAMANFILNNFIGNLTGLNDVIANITHGQYKAFNLQFILGYTFAPLMWAIGVPFEDMTLVGRLLGEKIIMSEFIAYVSLADLKDTLSFSSEKSIVMATYMLCGFANFASIGIQIGGIGSLAPNQRNNLSQFGIKALIGGSIASLFSASVVGMLF
ncbi:MAG: nucleoside transporter C-terminal domain-containing protein [Bacteroidales bacterium]|nr:nucleoside transporter C-terminal domain-containing protein [Bacteroidales bacterium]